MIEVGIQKNVKLVGAEVRPDPQGNALKDTLVLKLELASGGGGFSLKDLTGAEENVQDGNDQEYYLWPFDNKDKDGKQIDWKEALRRIKDFKAQLNHILSGYMTKDVIEAKWDSILFAGTGIVKDEDAPVMLVQEKPLYRVYKNIATGFVELITPHLSDINAPKFRVKFTRQSKAKHFSRLPKYAPFWESMDIPEDQSKLAYTQWEIDNKFNDGTPATDAPAPDSTGSNEELDAVNDVFGETQTS